MGILAMPWNTVCCREQLAYDTVEYLLQKYDSRTLHYYLVSYANTSARLRIAIFPQPYEIAHPLKVDKSAISLSLLPPISQKAVSAVIGWLILCPTQGATNPCN